MRVLVVTCWWEGFVRRQVELIGQSHEVTVWRLPFSGWPRLAERWRASLAGRAMPEADVVHAYGAWPAGLAASRADAPLVLHEHLSPPEDLSRYRVEEVFERADVVLSPSDEHASTLARMFGCRPRVVANPVAVPLGDRMRRVNARPRVGAFGRMVAQKRFDLLVDAAHELPGLDFVIAGDGPERANLERRAPENVTLIRWQAEPWNLIRSCDVICCPSRHESFGLAACEAAAMGLPVVATDVGLHREVAERLTTPGTLARDLAAVVDDLAGASARAAGRAHAVREWLSPKRFMEEMDAAYRAVRGAAQVA